MDQMEVDGVVESAVKAGPSSSPPVLRTATPLAVPLISSSNLDCSQVRVPSAKRKESRTRTGKITSNQRRRIKFIPQDKVLGGEFRLPRCIGRHFGPPPWVMVQSGFHGTDNSSKPVK